MANLNKTSSGLLFYDDFSEKTLMWTLSPSDANNLSFGENGLQLKHNKRYVSYTIVEPSVEEYSCVIHLDHVPVNRNDIAGILIMSANKKYAECQSYVATGPSELINSEQYEYEIEELVRQLMDESNYVQWFLNDEEVVALPENPTESSTDRLPGTPVDETKPFVDVRYPYIKFTKMKTKYVFWASVDSFTWIEIGNVKFDNSGIIGFFIYGAEEEQIIRKSHCYVKNFALYNSKFITFDGITRDHECEIVDDLGNIVLRTDSIAYAHMISRSNKQILINTITTPMPIQNGILRVYPKNQYENTIGTYDLGEKVYGGDSFTLERNLKLYINGIELKPTDLYDLGTFYHGSYYIKIDIVNEDEYDIADVKLKVIAYSEYYGGEHEVAIALYKDLATESELEYSKEITIDFIHTLESKSFFMKLTDIPIQDFYMTAQDYRFKIIIE